MLSQMLQENTISRSLLRTVGIEAVTQAATKMGGFWPEFVGPLRGVLAGSPHDESWLRRRGIDVVAARGWRGQVSRPTLAMLGEGPEAEDVTITPVSQRGFTGGGSGGGQVVINNTFNVTTPNPQSFQQWYERELWPIQRQQMMAASRAGEPLINSKGVVNG
jgi:hypothetical protein